MTSLERLFEWRSAFDHPATLWIVVGIASLLAAAPLIILVISATRGLSANERAKIFTTWRSWLVMAPVVVLPILLGAAWVIAGAAVLAIASYREFARVTGLFRERITSAVVVVTILTLFFAVLDHWYAFFVAIFPLSTALVAGTALLADRPRGYIQRVALALLAIALFGGGFGHLAYCANDELYRPILLWLIVCVEMNDVFAYTTGRLFGRRKLCPATSPNKTVAGALGALVCTTTVGATIGHFAFAGTAVDAPIHLLTLGAIVSAAGQFGDLTLSSIKRDIGVKDTGTLIPGHGGILDRVDSLLLAAPAVFHYVGYLRGFGVSQATRIITGS